MRLLLDSHVLVWWLSAPDKLSPESVAAIASTENEVYASSASLWELHLKAAKGKLTMPLSIRESLTTQHIDELRISWEHAEAIRQLPAIHSDPFDRILIAQAMVENLTLVTRDELILQYDLPAMRC